MDVERRFRGEMGGGSGGLGSDVVAIRGTSAKLQQLSVNDA